MRVAPLLPMAGLLMAGLLLPALAHGQAPQQPSPRAARPRPPPEREAVIVNQSGQTLRELYAAQPGSAAFGPDLLGADTVPDRGSFRIRLGAERACLLEFRAVFQDGSEERRRADICQNRRVTLGDPGAPPREAVLRNESDQVLQQLFAVPRGTAGRGPDRLGADVVPPGGEYRLRLGRSRGCVFDVTAVFEDGEEVARPNLDLCRQPRLVFGDPGTPRRESRVTNAADRTIRELYASMRGPDAWGPDRLGSEVLPVGQSFTLRLRGRDCLWDLRAVFDDDTAEEKRRVDLCASAGITFDGTGAPRPAERRVLLVNRHGAAVQEAYLSAASDEEWGPDRLGEDTLPPGARREIGARIPGCEADLRIVFEERRGAEERSNINLCQVAVIVLRPGWTLTDRLEANETEGEAPPRPGSLRLRNGTAQPVAEIYAVPPGGTPGADLLGRTVLGAGETLDITPPEGTPCQSELVAVFRDGRELRLPGTDLCAGTELVLR